LFCLSFICSLLFVLLLVYLYLINLVIYVVEMLTHKHKRFVFSYLQIIYTLVFYVLILSRWSFFCAVSKRSGDIREILSCGKIRVEDLDFLAVLGSGNCGVVHKLVDKIAKWLNLE